MNDIVARLKYMITQTGPVNETRRLVIEHLTRSESELPILWHPLGFIDIPIERDSSGKLVIHVWHPDFGRPQLPQQICHSHGWTLHSAVLAGAIENQTFEVASDQAGDQRLYKVRYDGPKSISDPLDKRVTSKRVDEVQLYTGEQYTVADNSFHWSQGLGTLVITVMCASFAQAGPAYVVRPWSSTSTYTYVREPCDRTARDVILADVMQAIRG